MSTTRLLISTFVRSINLCIVLTCSYWKLEAAVSGKLILHHVDTCLQTLAVTNKFHLKPLLLSVSPLHWHRGKHLNIRKSLTSTDLMKVARQDIKVSWRDRNLYHVSVFFQIPFPLCTGFCSKLLNIIFVFISFLCCCLGLRVVKLHARIIKTLITALCKSEMCHCETFIIFNIHSVMEVLYTQ